MTSKGYSGKQPQRKYFVRMSIFILIGYFLFSLLQNVFLMGPFTQYYQERVSRDSHTSFHDEPASSLDAVYVGSSLVYAWWQAPLAWDRYGITVHPYTASCMPAASLCYIIDLCRQSQPDALYIINVGNVDFEEDFLQRVHYTTDDIAMSPRKVAIINSISNRWNYDWEMRLELLFPMYVFHDTWNMLSTEDYTPHYALVKGAAMYDAFLSTRDMSEFLSNPASDSNPTSWESLDELMKYLRMNDVKVLFVIQPVGEGLPEEYKCAEYIRRNGFDVVDLSNYELMGIDPVTDYYNGRHLNAHGAIKFTDYLANYLVDTYDFEDKRGQEGFESWDTAAELYSALLQTRNIYDYELALEPSQRLVIVSGLSATSSSESIQISWNVQEEATSYIIYRRADGASSIDNPAIVDNLSSYVWTQVASVDGAECTYTDFNIEVGTCYEYSVVPILGDGSTAVYGWCPSGVTATAL